MSSTEGVVARKPTDARMEEALEELEGTAPHMRERIEASRGAKRSFVWNLPVELEIVLGRARMSVERLVALQPGDRVDLEAQGTLDILANGTLVARGRLEEDDGSLVVRVEHVEGAA